MFHFLSSLLACLWETKRFTLFRLYFYLNNNCGRPSFEVFPWSIFHMKACLFLKPLYCIHREKQVPGTPEFWLFNDLILTSIWSMKKNPAAILSQNSSENLISFLMLWVNKNMGGNSEETTYQTDKMPWHWWQIPWKGF